MVEKLKSNYLLILVLVLSTALFIFYLKIQPRLTHEFSPLFDANKYMKVYNYFEGTSEDYNVPFPIHSRILIPAIATLLPFEEPVHNFLLINYLFMILSITVIYFLWKMVGLSPGYIMTGFFWLLVHWVGILRLNIYDPVTVDVPLYFFQALFLILIYKNKYHLLILLGPVATLQKESFIGLLAVLFLVEFYRYFKYNHPLRNLITIGIGLFLSIIVKEIANNYFPPAQPGHSSLITVLFHARETLLNPFRFVRWIIGVFTAFGPLLLLSIWWKIKKRSFSISNLDLIVFSVAYAGFSLLGGGDFTRLAFLGFPFVMTWVLISLNDVRGFLFKMAFLMGLPLMRIFSTIPDPAVQGWIKFNNFYPEFANPVIVLLWLVYGIGCVITFQITHKKLAMLP